MLLYWRGFWLQGWSGRGGREQPTSAQLLSLGHGGFAGPGRGLAVGAGLADWLKTAQEDNAGRRPQQADFAVAAVVGTPQPGRSEEGYS